MPQYVHAPPTPEEALDWVRKMMAIQTPETARELQKMTTEHEHIIMGGWDRRQRKYFPGLLITFDTVQKQIRFILVLLVIVVVGTGAPAWWPILRSFMP